MGRKHKTHPADADLQQPPDRRHFQDGGYHQDYYQQQPGYPPHEHHQGYHHQDQQEYDYSQDSDPSDPNNQVHMVKLFTVPIKKGINLKLYRKNPVFILG